MAMFVYHTTLQMLQCHSSSSSIFPQDLRSHAQKKNSCCVSCVSSVIQEANAEIPNAKWVARWHEQHMVTRLQLGSHTFCWRLIPYASLTPRAELKSSHIFAQARHVPVTRTSKKPGIWEKHGKTTLDSQELPCLRLCPLVSHLTPKHGRRGGGAMGWVCLATCALDSSWTDCMY